MNALDAMLTGIRSRPDPARGRAPSETDTAAAFEAVLGDLEGERSVSEGPAHEARADETQADETSAEPARPEPDAQDAAGGLLAALARWDAGVPAQLPPAPPASEDRAATPDALQTLFARAASSPADIPEPAKGERATRDIPAAAPEMRQGSVTVLSRETHFAPVPASAPAARPEARTPSAGESIASGQAGATSPAAPDPRAAESTAGRARRDAASRPADSAVPTGRAARTDDAARTPAPTEIPQPRSPAGAAGPDLAGLAPAEDTARLPDPETAAWPRAASRAGGSDLPEGLAVGGPEPDARVSPAAQDTDRREGPDQPDVRAASDHRVQDAPAEAAAGRARPGSASASADPVAIPTGRVAAGEGGDAPSPDGAPAPDAGAPLAPGHGASGSAASRQAGASMPLDTAAAKTADPEMGSPAAGGTRAASATVVGAPRGTTVPEEPVRTAIPDTPEPRQSPNAAADPDLAVPVRPAAPETRPPAIVVDTGRGAAQAPVPPASLDHAEESRSARSAEADPVPYADDAGPANAHAPRPVLPASGFGETVAMPGPVTALAGADPAPAIPTGTERTHRSAATTAPALPGAPARGGNDAAAPGEGITAPETPRATARPTRTETGGSGPASPPGAAAVAPPSQDGSVTEPASSAQAPPAQSAHSPAADRDAAEPTIHAPAKQPGALTPPADAVRAISPQGRPAASPHAGQASDGVAPEKTSDRASGAGRGEPPPAPREAPAVAEAPGAGMAPPAASALPLAALRQIVEAVATAAPAAPVSDGGALPIAGREGPLRLMTLQLRPEALGTVLVQMRLRDGRLEMTLRASREDTAEWLRQDQDALSDLLREAGYRPDGLTVQSGAAEPQARATEGPAGQPLGANDGHNPGGSTPDHPARRPAPQRAEARAPEPTHDGVLEVPGGEHDRRGLYL